MSGNEKKRGYIQGDYDSGNWYEEYLYPGEHHGQPSGKGAKANHRINMMRQRKDDYGGHSPGIAPTQQRNLGYSTRKRQAEQEQTSLGNPKGLRDLENNKGKVSKKKPEKQKDAVSELRKAFNAKKR